MSKERHNRKKAREMLHKAGYKSGTHLGGVKRLIGEAVHEHEGSMHKGAKKTPIRLKDGGCADGGKPPARADRLARGGKSKAKHKGGKSHVTVNVINAHGAPKPPVMVKPPMPMPPPGAMAGPPGGVPPPPPDGGGAPPPFKRGGRTKAPKIDNQRDTKGGMPAGHFKKGGRTKASYPIDDGAGGGLGRIEKAKAYGA